MTLMIRVILARAIRTKLKEFLDGIVAGADTNALGSAWIADDEGWFYGLDASNIGDVSHLDRIDEWLLRSCNAFSPCRAGLCQRQYPLFIKSSMDTSTDVRDSDDDDECITDNDDCYGQRRSRGRQAVRRWVSSP